MYLGVPNTRQRTTNNSIFILANEQEEKLNKSLITEESTGPRAVEKEAEKERTRFVS